MDGGSNQAVNTMTIRRTMILIVLAGAIGRLGYQMARSPVLPLFGHSLGANGAYLGLIVAASTITGIAIKLPAGALSDLWGRRTLLRLGGIFFAVPPLLYVFVHSSQQLLALRFVHGLATAIFGPVAAAVVAGLSEKDRGARLGWVASANDLGATAGPLIGGFVLAWTASFYDVYWVVAVIGLIALVMIWTLPKGLTTRQITATAGGPGRWATFGRGLWEVVTSPPVLLTSAMEASLYIGYGAFLAFFPLYGRSIGLPVVAITIILGVQLATTLAAKPLTGSVSDRIGRKPMIIAGLILCAIVLPTTVRTQNAILLGVLSALFGLGVAIVTPSTTALVADLVKARSMGSAMGVFGTIWDSGEAGGPILAGALITAIAYGNSFLIISGIMLTAMLVFLLTVHDPKPAPIPA
jgi:MFS family permease